MFKMKLNQQYNPHEGHEGQDESYALERNASSSNGVDDSMDSSLPSAVQPRYQVYPHPPSGVRSLMGGTVNLDGDSVQVDSSMLLSGGVVGNDSQDEHEILFEHESIASSAASGNRPPSFVNLSYDLSSIGASMYDNIMTFRILGTSKMPSPIKSDATKGSPHKKPKALLQPPPRIQVATAQKSPSKSTLITPSTDVSLASTAFNSPVKVIEVPHKNKTSTGASVPSTVVASDSSGGSGCCCPYWIQRSPLWLKIFLLCSLLFFILSTSLIAVAVVMAVKEENDANAAAEQVIGNTQAPVDVPPSNPAPTPMATTSATASTTATTVATSSITATTQANTTVATTAATEPDNTPSAPLEDIPLVPTATPIISVSPAPSILQTSVPSFLPVTGPEVFQTTAPSVSPTAARTFQPTGAWDNTVTTFYVTAGTWDANVDPAVVLPRMPVQNDRAFVIHLGNWNAGSGQGGTESVDCRPTRYEEEAEFWSQSASPVYFLMGHAESNACENPDNALAEWRDNLLSYHEAFWPRPRWTFWDDEWTGYPEMFVFDAPNNVVICGLHLTAGSVTQEADNARRPIQAGALEWIDINFNYYPNRFRTFFILANAPMGDEVHAEFFTTLLERIQQDYRRMSFVYVQAGSVARLEENYRGIENLDVLTVVEDIWPPMQIQVNAGASISINQNDWFDELTGLTIST